MSWRPPKNIVVSFKLLWWSQYAHSIKYICDFSFKIWRVGGWTPRVFLVRKKAGLHDLRFSGECFSTRVLVVCWCGELFRATPWEGFQFVMYGRQGCAAEFYVKNVIFVSSSRHHKKEIVSLAVFRIYAVFCLDSVGFLFGEMGKCGVIREFGVGVLWATTLWSVLLAYIGVRVPTHKSFHIKRCISTIFVQWMEESWDFSLLS